MNSFLILIIWGLLGALVLAGAGLGWWYGTATFYRREIGEDYVLRDISRGRRMRRSVRRIGLTLFGAAGGALAGYILVVVLAQMAARQG
ncbi:MAG: hypothetical protein Q8N31_18925 [Reyranella sp.]|nr:hypothetical protein [Reyranella sp.]MDP3162089.1 hypothetical protein [Reyranella sp.]